MAEFRHRHETKFPSDFTSTPISTPEGSSDQFETAMKSALNVITNCIANSEDLINLCKNYQQQEGINMTPGLKIIVDRIIEDTKAVVNLNAKVAKIKESVKSDNFETIKNDFDGMMRGIDTISNEKLKMFSALICLTEASHVRKRLAQSEKELNEMDPSLLPDDKMKKLARVLVERNKTIMDCLDNFYALMSKLPDAVSGQPGPTKSCSKLPKKLFILGENLQQKLPDLAVQTKLIGSVVIEDESGKCRSPSRRKFDQPNDYRYLLSGFLEEDNGNLQEVRLELTEPIGDLINFSEDSSGFDRPLTARVEINGNPLEMSLPVVEIDLLDKDMSAEAARVIAIVENKETGMPQKVELSLIPTSPEKQIHGKILEIQSASRQSQIRKPMHQSICGNAKQLRCNPNNTLKDENCFKTAKPRDSLANPSLRRPERNAKQVFKEIAHIVNTLSAMGADAITDEASR